MGIEIVRNQRKNADGSYDIVHPETQAKAVWMSDGRSVEEAMPKESRSTVVTLSSSNWTAQSNGRYTQSATVSFMTTDAPVVSVDVYMSGTDVDADDTMEAAYLGNVYRMTQGAGAVTFWARSIPEVNIQVSIGVS